METEKRFKIAALYRFLPFEQPETVKGKVQGLCKQYEVHGMLIIATEGINGTIAAEVAKMDGFLEELYALEPRLIGLEIKFSYNNEQPFHNLRVCVKSEIVTLGVEGYSVHQSQKIIDVEPAEWDSVIAQDDVVVVDARNDYEVQLGTFTGALNPNTKSFKEFPQYIKQLSSENEAAGRKKKSLAMFCTGGIRCDKVAAFVADTEDYDHIYTLKGGILRYLEEIPEEASKWQGECFVFDKRVTVKHGLVPGDCKFCRGCRHPLTPEDCLRSDFLEDVHCRHCIDRVTEEKLQAAAERRRQSELSLKRSQQQISSKDKKKKSKKM